MNREVFELIKEKWSCVDYARLVLGLPIFKPGDRCVSWRPDAKNPTSLLVENDHWVDFGADTRGDVIDMCAIARHNGDKGAAIRELGGDDIGDFSGWKNYTERLTQKINFWHSALRPQDYDYLHSRRISDDTINRLNLGYSAHEDRLVIPYTKNGHYCYTIGRDRSGSENAAKYKKMFIDQFNEHVPWGLHTLTKDFDDRHEDYILTSDGVPIPRKKILCIAEGAFDAMSFEQEGFHVLSPIAGFFSKKTQLKTVLSAAKDKSCDFVFICFDSDSRGTAFQKNMAEICFSNRINFKCGVLPSGVKDVSDFYAAGGNIADLIHNAKDSLAVLAANYTDREDFAKFLRDAARFVRKSDIVAFCKHLHQFDSEWVKAVVAECTKTPSEQIIIDDILNNFMIKFIEGNGFFEYRHGVWKATPDNIIKSYIADSLGLYASGSRLSSICSFLKARTTSQEEFNKQNIFNLVNGTLNLESGKLEDHSPSFMSSIQAPFAYSKDADCPQWKKFIAEVMINDPQKISLLQEVAGYPLYPDCSLQKCFFLMGDGSNGKSVFIDVLNQVFGDDNCSTVEISALASPFDAIRLRHSLLNISAETKSNIKEADAKFKAVITGDKISSAYKGKDAIEFRPRAKWICATNSYISSNDITYGMTRRIIFIRFPRTFKGSEIDTELTKKLAEEKAGIFNWLFAGYQRLRKQNAFTHTDEQEDLMNEFMCSINPILSFAEEKLSLFFGQSVPAKVLYREYVSWAKEGGYTPQHQSNFTRNLKAVLQNIAPGSSFKKSHGESKFDFASPDFGGSK